MAHVTIDLAKRQVNLDEITSEDDYLQHLLEAAEVHVANITHRTIAEIIETYGVDEDGDGINDDLPPTLKHAILLMVAHWYNQREAVAAVQMREVPQAFKALILPYKRLSYDRQVIDD